MNAHWKRIAAVRLTLLAALWAGLGIPAMAHQSYITTTLGAASGSLLETIIRGQWGFKDHSPWYFKGEAGWSGIPSAPRDNSLRLGGELGYEGRHLGGGVRFGNLSFSGTEAASFQTGGYLFYRVITIARLWKREVDLSHEDRDYLLKKRIRQREDEVALAPVILGEYDTFDTESDLDTGILRALRIKMSLTWKFSPWFRLTPSYEGYTYTLNSENETSKLALTSRHNRTVLSGPNGPHAAYLGVFGRTSNVMQLNGHFVMTLRESISATLSRVAIANGRAYGSLWLGYHRRVDDRARWAVTPGFEHVRSGTDHFSFFTVSFSYIPNAPYIPPRDYTQ